MNGKSSLRHNRKNALHGLELNMTTQSSKHKRKYSLIPRQLRRSKRENIKVKVIHLNQNLLYMPKSEKYWLKKRASKTMWPKFLWTDSMMSYVLVLPVRVLFRRKSPLLRLVQQCWMKLHHCNQIKKAIIDYFQKRSCIRRECVVNWS